MEPEVLVEKAAALGIKLDKHKVYMAARVSFETVGAFVRAIRLLEAKDGSSERFNAQDELQDHVSETMADYLMLDSKQKALMYPALYDFVWQNEALICTLTEFN